MAGRFGQVVLVAPKQDMVIVFTPHLPDAVGDVGVARWLAKTFILRRHNKQGWQGAIILYAVDSRKC